MTDLKFLLIDKPAGWTSFDIVAKLRSITGIRKIGHAGTLDPFATGLLVVAIGREATKLIDNFMGMDKVYEAKFVLGATTDSLDTETEIIIDSNMPEISQDQILQAMQQLTGQIDQIPPMHSAIKINGKRLYKLARQGEEIKREPRHVTIHKFELVSPTFKGGDGGGCRQIVLEVKIKCSSGTYVRALARDLGKILGTTGYVRSLRRTKIGNIPVSDATEISAVNSENWQKLVKNLENIMIDGTVR
ncbi:tRNA pseudouridine(55) synthase TruB [Patescibacteria group bacterium]|nr:tRNA pseudouridine(55) synthase TruB [Patescibacteria group bacterium]MBU4453159.1 tRNA pseudouridine(55) synthase TruB [Patescibacteria group bacterium]MCG2687592.1 tRNA pseudouridine(55) synthase TruB [Candidatus Parcubacteria bacterium]